MTVSDTPGPDWVAALGRVDPDLYAQLLRARIRDEGSYLQRERLLPSRVRTLTAQVRRDLLLLDRIPIGELVRVSPPWLLELSLERIGAPASVCEKRGGLRVRDLPDLLGEVGPEEAAALRFALYRAGRARAPRREVPEPATDRVRALIASASAALWEAPIDEVPGLPRRVRNALVSGQVGTVGDLDRWTDEELKLLPQFGRKSLEDLLVCLEEAAALYGDAEPPEEREPDPCP
jgi:hypothetical protein